ncbi:hypothetical protein G6F35_016028 [Rhizopus arrhizus]|nr:hypothetical protein G6F35_016028 [Rhizopus arrhizus]
MVQSSSSTRRASAQASDQRLPAPPAPPAPINAVTPGPGAGQQQESTGQPQVLQEHDLLGRVGDVVVEDESGDQAETHQHDRHQAGLETEQDAEPAADLEGDGRPQQDARHAHRFHVALGGTGVAELADAGDQEQRHQQEACKQVGERMR